MQSIRSGLLSQKEVIDVVNRYFVPVEVNITSNGLPEYGGFEHYRRMWSEIPWTRASFGADYVLDPSGEVLLANLLERCPHMNGPGGQAIAFQRKVAVSLERFARLRSCERGSEAEQREIERIKVAIIEDGVKYEACTDVEVFTRHTVEILCRRNPVIAEQKISGVFAYPDPAVRKMAADALGDYAERYPEKFRANPAAPFLIRMVNDLLEDPEKDVRQAAAVALHHFDGRPLPDTAG